MKRISQLRGLIRDIPGVFEPIPPEERERANDPALKTVWDTDSQNGSISDDRYASICPNDKDETEESVSESEAAIPVEDLFEFGAVVDEKELQEAFGGELGKGIKKSVEIFGVDALGWYVPFHYQGAQPGIYIPTSSILWMSSQVFAPLKTDFQTKFKLAFRAIHQHELFHFATEYMLTQWEVVANKAIYLKAIKESRNPELIYCPVEEELANAQMLLALKNTPPSLRIAGKTRLLKKFMRQQPEGYCDSILYNKDVFDNESNIHAACYLHENISFPLQDEDLWENFDFLQLYERFPQLDWRYCPIHIVEDEKRLSLPMVGLDLFRAIPTIFQTKQFDRSLEKLPQDIQKQWERAKNKLQQTTAIGALDFKLWEKRQNISVYSVRLNRGYRAHLEYDYTAKNWQATEIGTHKHMGHG